MPSTATRTRRQIPQQEVPAKPVRMVGGLAVVSDEALPSPLPTPPGGKPITFNSIRVLTLEDGTTVHGCANCEFTGEGRGAVQKHRAKEHGAHYARGERARGRKPKPEQPPLPPEVGGLTMAELLMLARDASHWSDAFAGIEGERDDWKRRALAAETQVRKITNALDRAGFVLRVDDEED